MILKILGLLLAAPLFFWSVYRGSRCRPLAAWVWLFLGLAALGTIAASIVTLVIPDFFSPGP